MEKLRFYNSLTKQIEVFKPQQAGKVRIYNCGPTVYQRQHVGNMRRFLFADFLRRTLELAGYEVREVTNITDVGHLTEDDIDAGEDKIEKAARRQKVAPQEIAEKQASLFFDDLKQLNIQPAHAYPRASQHIPQMQKLISQLIKAGHAYETPTNWRIWKLAGALRCVRRKNIRLILLCGCGMTNTGKSGHRPGEWGTQAGTLNVRP